jgi:hypothetical protein
VVRKIVDRRLKLTINYRISGKNYSSKMNNNITITNVKGEVGFVCEVKKTVNGLSNIFPAVIETQVRRSGNI